MLRTRLARFASANSNQKKRSSTRGRAAKKGALYGIGAGIGLGTAANAALAARMTPEAFELATGQANWGVGKRAATGGIGGALINTVSPTRLARNAGLGALGGLGVYQARKLMAKKNSRKRFRRRAR